jgi:hypothetical protein
MVTRVQDMFLNFYDSFTRAISEADFASSYAVLLNNSFFFFFVKLASLMRNRTYVQISLYEVRITLNNCQ